jgi:hypothetical protein
MIFELPDVLSPKSWAPLYYILFEIARLSGKHVFESGWTLAFESSCFINLSKVTAHITNRRHCSWILHPLHIRDNHHLRLSGLTPAHFRKTARFSHTSRVPTMYSNPRDFYKRKPLAASYGRQNVTILG